MKVPLSVLYGIRRPFSPFARLSRPAILIIPSLQNMSPQSQGISWMSFLSGEEYAMNGLSSRRSEYSVSSPM